MLWETMLLNGHPWQRLEWDSWLEDIGFEVNHGRNFFRSRTGACANEESFENNNTTCANNHQQDQDQDVDEETKE